MKVKCRKTNSEIDVIDVRSVTNCDKTYFEYLINLDVDEKWYNKSEFKTIPDKIGYELYLNVTENIIL